MKLVTAGGVVVALAAVFGAVEVSKARTVETDNAHVDGNLLALAAKVDADIVAPGGSMPWEDAGGPPCGGLRPSRCGMPPCAAAAAPAMPAAPARAEPRTYTQTDSAPSLISAMAAGTAISRSNAR